ncbi:MAG: cytochrome c biogenesis heme-transporting ATPase CcmA [Alphaproteobacteria bacterium]
MPNVLGVTSLACVRGERPIFVDLDFKLSDGDLLQVSGRNGAGKSSLLRVLTGLLPYSHGALTWNNQNIEDCLPDYRQNLHYIGHKNPIKDRLTVFENLLIWAKILGQGTTQNFTANTTAALEAFQLVSLKDIPARMLSSGQRRRLTLAKLLLQDRSLWVLDEPTVGLDHASVSKLEIMIEDHRRKGGIAVVTTHSRMTLLQAQKLNMDEHNPADRDLSAFWLEAEA